MASLQPTETDKEEDLDDSTTLDSSLSEHQTMNLKGQVSLQAELIEAQRKKTDENRFYAEMKKEIEKLRQCCHAYEETIQGMLKSHSELENALKKLEGNCDSELNAQYKSKLDKLEREISDKNKLINSIEHTIQKNETIISVLWEDLKKCKVIIEGLEQENRQIKQKYEGEYQNDGEILKASHVNLLITKFTKESPLTDSQNDRVNTRHPQIEQCLEEIATQKKLIDNLDNEIIQLKQNYEKQIHTQARKLIETEKKLNICKQEYDKEIARKAQQLKDKIKHYKSVESDHLQEIKELTKQILHYKSIESKHTQQIADQAKQIQDAAKERFIIEKKYKEQVVKLQEVARELTIIEHEYKELNIEELIEAVKEREQKYKEQLAHQAKQIKGAAKKREQEYEEQIAKLQEAVKKHDIIEQKYKEEIVHQAQQLKEATKKHSIIEHECKEQIIKLNEARKKHGIIEQKYKEEIAHQATQLKEAARKHNTIEHEYKEQIIKLKEAAKEHDIIEQKYKDETASQLRQLINVINDAEKLQTAQITRIDQLNETNQELIVKLDFYESENKKDYENNQAIVNQLLGTLHISQVELKSQALAKYKLQCAVRSTMASKSQLTEEVKQLSALLDEKTSLLNTLNKELGNVTKQLEESNKESENLTKQLEKSNKELENVTKQLEEQSSKIKVLSLEKREGEEGEANKIKQLTNTIRKLREDIDTIEKSKQILEQTLESERSEKVLNETFIGNLLFDWSKMLQGTNTEFPLMNLETKLLKFDEMLSTACLALPKTSPMITLDEDSMSSTSSNKESSTCSIPTAEFDEGTLAQDETSNDIFGEIGELNRNTSKLSLEFQFDETFPLTSTLLSGLCIQDDNLIYTLTVEEREEFFNKIIAQISPEKTKERVKICKQQCQNQYIKFHYLIKDISVRLRDHKCIGASASVNPVFILLEDLRLLLQEIMHSSCNLGTLMCEETTVQQWNFLKDYVRCIQTLHRKDFVNKKVGTEKIEVDVAIEPVEASKTNNYKWYGCAILMAILALIFAYWKSQRSEDEHKFTFDD